MTNLDIPQSNEPERAEFRALLAYFWAGRLIVILTMIASILVGFVWYRITPRIYEASMVLSTAPASMANTQQNGNALSGAARLFGLGGGGAGGEFTKFQALLGSSLLAQRLAAKPGLLQQMFSGQWDSNAHVWRTSSSGLLSPLKDAMHKVLGTRPRRTPDAQDVLGYLRGNLDQDFSLQTSLLTLTMRSSNPDFAQMFLATADREADDILRDAARSRSRRRIEYLQETLLKVNAIEQRQALIELLSQEEQNNMMVESDPNYAADIVDPPHVSPAPVSPNFIATMFISIVGGFVAGLVLYLVLRAFNLHVIRIEWNPMRWPQAFLPHRH